MQYSGHVVLLLADSAVGRGGPRETGWAGLGHLWAGPHTGVVVLDESGWGC